MSSDQSYPERLASLKDNAIALWDVCARGDRAGSLDAEIEIATAIPNDFGKFFDRHSSIELICFNGASKDLIRTSGIAHAAAFRPTCKPCDAALNEFRRTPP